MHCTVGKKAHVAMNSLKQSTRGRRKQQGGLAGLVRNAGFLSDGKLSIRINAMCTLEAKAAVEGRLSFPVPELVHALCTVLPLPQWDSGISLKCADTKTPPAPCAQNWYLNCTKGQSWQAQQLISAFLYQRTEMGLTQMYEWWEDASEHDTNIDQFKYKSE